MADQYLVSTFKVPQDGTRFEADPPTEHTDARGAFSVLTSSLAANLVLQGFRQLMWAFASFS